MRGERGRARWHRDEQTERRRPSLASFPYFVPTKAPAMLPSEWALPLLLSLPKCPVNSPVTALGSFARAPDAVASLPQNLAVQALWPAPGPLPVVTPGWVPPTKSTLDPAFMSDGPSVRDQSLISLKWFSCPIWIQSVSSMSSLAP